MRLCSRKRPTTLDDANVFADAGDSGTQTADAADQEIDFDSGLRGLVEKLDHAAVDERVHLEDEVAVAIFFVVVDFAADEVARSDRGD